MKKKVYVLLSFFASVISFTQCSKTDLGTTVANFQALPLTVTAPSDNLQTTQKIALGKLLFYDPILSGNKDVACATCHHPSLGFSDGRDLSIGVNGQGLGAARHFLSPNTIPFAKRNSLSILNAAFNGITADGVYNPANAAMFFDNRVHSLELQSLEPIKTMEEMRGGRISPDAILDTVVARLKTLPDYVQLFSSAFGAANAITSQNIGKAVATYERTLITSHSPYDEYMRGDKSAMTTTQVQGMNAFVANGCHKCHSGPMFSDYQLHILSVPDNAKLPSDAGVNGAYAFRTPSLRNLSQTAPYMHSGTFANLAQVLNFYDQIGDGRSQNTHVSRAQLDGNLQRINNNDRQAIIQFLEALNETGFDRQIPATVPSGLHPGGND